MRGLSPLEREALEEILRPGPDVDIPRHLDGSLDALHARGLAEYEVDRGDRIWDVTPLGRLILTIPS